MSVAGIPIFKAGSPRLGIAKKFRSQISIQTLGPVEGSLLFAGLALQDKLYESLPSL